MDGMDLIIGGIALAPIIVALVEVAKKYLGLPSNYAPLANAALSALAYVGMTVLGYYPGYTDWVVVGLTVLTVFLSAAGFYTTAKHVLKK